MYRLSDRAVLVVTLLLARPAGPLAPTQTRLDSTTQRQWRWRPSKGRRCGLTVSAAAGRTWTRRHGGLLQPSFRPMDAGGSRRLESPGSRDRGRERADQDDASDVFVPASWNKRIDDISITAPCLPHQCIWPLEFHKRISRVQFYPSPGHRDEFLSCGGALAIEVEKNYYKMVCVTRADSYFPTVSSNYEIISSFKYFCVKIYVRQPTVINAVRTLINLASITYTVSQQHISTIWHKRIVDSFRSHQLRWF